MRYLQYDVAYYHPHGAANCKNRLKIGKSYYTSLQFFTGGAQKDSQLPVLRVEFSLTAEELRHNRYFTHAGIRGVLKGKYHGKLEVVFLFVAAFVDCALTMESTGPMKKGNKKYAELSSILYRTHKRMIWSKVAIRKLKEKVKALKTEVVEQFGLHSHSGVNKLKFHLLEYIAKGLEWFETLSVLKNARYEHYKWHVKAACRSPSRRRRTALHETVQNVEWGIRGRRRC